MKITTFSLLVAWAYSSAISASPIEETLTIADEVGAYSGALAEKGVSQAQEGYENRKLLGSHEKTVVEGIQATLESDEFLQEQARWREALSSAMGSSWGKPEQTSPNEEQKLPYSDRPILFVSSSMPLHTLRTYAADLEKVGGAMVVRGFVGGMSKIQPTLKFVGDILKMDPHCDVEPCDRRAVEVLIDPILFREYGVKAVPAFTINDLTNLSGYCKGTNGLNPSSVVVYGDNSLKYLAERFAKESEKEVSPVIKDNLG